MRLCDGSNATPERLVGGNGQMKRGICLACGGKGAINKDGTIRRHSFKEEEKVKELDDRFYLIDGKF
jgi:hypothetical protein